MKVSSIEFLVVNSGDLAKERDIEGDGEVG